MNSTAVSIVKDPRFDLEGFLGRWKMARISALQSLGAVGPVEETLLVQLNDFDRGELLRRVFDQSRKFGLSAAKYFGLTFEITDLAEILQKSKMVCLGGGWEPHKAAFVLKRPGCAFFKVWGALGCDYWREVLDGLVMGVGENERIARHRSLGHGDSECVDILFTEEFTVPRVVRTEPDAPGASRPKYGPIESEVLERFEPVFTRFKQMKIQLVLEGVSEGTLYYRLDPEKGVLCGAGGKLMHETFLRDTKKLFPDLNVLDAAPLAVYGGST